MDTTAEVTATINLAPLAEKVGARLDVLESGVAKAAAGVETLARVTTDGMVRADQAITRAELAHNAALARIAELEAAIARIKTPAPCEINLVEAGCRPNDLDFDNAPIVNRILERLGGNFGSEAGWLTTSLYLPAGGFYARTPVETPLKTAFRIRGNGLAHALNENHYWSPNRKAMGGSTSRWIYDGDPKTPAFRIHSLGDIVDGLVVQRGQLPNHRTDLVRDGSIAFELCGDTQPPVGKTEFRSLAVLGFDCGIHAAGIAGDSHADESRVGFAWFQDCRTVFRSDAVQATQWHFATLKVAGLCETVFDWQEGGGMLCDQLSLMSSALVLRLRKPREHYAAFRLNSLKVDGVCNGWRLLEVTDKAWLLQLYVWGEIGKGAIPAPGAVAYRGPAGRQFITIDVVDGNTCALWDWKSTAKIEVTK